MGLKDQSGNAEEWAFTTEWREYTEACLRNTLHDETEHEHLRLLLFEAECAVSNFQRLFNQIQTRCTLLQK